MPAFYINNNGAMVYYFPPPPPPPPPPAPPPTGTNVPGFKSAVAGAHKATNSYECGHGSKTTVEDDWGNVENIIEEQYRLALNSSDPHAAVAALNKQFGSYFQHEGCSTSIYNEVVTDGRKGAKSETTDMRNAQVQLFNAYNEPASSTTQPVDIITASLNVELQTQFGDGNDGAYTSTQINSAAAAVDKQFGSAAAPFVNYVAATLEGSGSGEGQTLNDVLNVLTTQGLTLTPAQIKSGSIGGLALTPAEIKAGTLILTSGETQLAKIDPVTLAFLMADGVKVTKLSQPMAQLAKENPALFSYMEINGVNITLSSPGGAATPGHPVFSLSKDSVLNITINGTPITGKQLPGWSATDAVTNVVGLYLGSEATSKGSGVVQLANMLLPQLQVSPKTLSTAESTLPSNPAAGNLVSLATLMQYADGVRSQYVNGQLTTLLATAPGATSSGAAGYIGGTINPFLSTQLNGFFSTDTQQAFWNSSTGVSALRGYLQTGLGAQFQSGNKNALSTASTYLTQALSGASPEEAQVLVGDVESQVDNLNLNTNNPYYHLGESRLLTALSDGVQIADQLPGAAPHAEAIQVAAWLNSSQGVQLLNNSANTLFDAAAYYGNSDLADALVNSIESEGGGRTLENSNVELGGEISEDVQNGEQYYIAAQTKQLGAVNYAAFNNNRTETLAAFNTQYSKAPDIGTKINTANTTTVRSGIISAFGYDPKNLTATQTHTVDLDLSWIQNQSKPGSTVTILPFLFASSTVGMQNGVFFDISNPNANDPQNPSQVLIDGSAAEVALTDDPTAYKHANSVDVTWHYSSYRDFQLHNEFYQGGTIYTLLNNPLGIGANGEASSDTDFHTDFDSVGNFVVNDVDNVAAIAFAPVTDGASLALAGLISLAWNTYTATEQYDQDVSHGEHFGWSNANTRWQIVGDAMLATNYLTLGAGAGASGFAKVAESLGEAADVQTSLSTLQNAVATLPDADAEGLTATVSAADTAPGLSDALNTWKGVNSGIATGLNGVKTGSEVVGYGLGVVQTGSSIYSTATQWDSETWYQKLEGLGNIGMGFLPFFIEPINEKLEDFVSGRNGDASQPETYGLGADYDPSRSLSISTETQQALAAELDKLAQSPSHSVSLEGFPRVTLADDGNGGVKLAPPTPDSSASQDGSESRPFVPSSGVAAMPPEAGDPFQAASQEAQSAFAILWGSDGSWTPEAWSAINDYVDQGLQSPDPALRAAAQEARNALGDPTQPAHGFILSEPESTALGAQLAADIHVTQREALAARQAKWQAELAATTNEHTAAAGEVPAPVTTATPTAITAAPIVTAETESTNSTNEFTAAASTGRIRTLAKSARTGGAPRVRALIKTGAAAATSTAIFIVDPTLAITSIEHLGRAVDYLAGQTLNNDGWDWFARSFQLGVKTVSELVYSRGGTKVLNNVLGDSGTYSNRDMRRFKLAVERYGLANSDILNPAKTKQATIEARQAIDDLHTFNSRYVNAKGRRLEFGPQTLDEYSARSAAIAKVYDAIAKLPGIDAVHEPHDLHGLFDRWNTSISFRLWDNSFKTVTRTMNIAHSVDPSGNRDAGMAIDSLVKKGTGARTQWADVGRVGDDYGYVLEQICEDLGSGEAVIRDVARLASRWLGALAPSKAIEIKNNWVDRGKDKFVVQLLASPSDSSPGVTRSAKFQTAYDKYDNVRNGVIMWGYPVGCAFWAAEDGFGNKYPAQVLGVGKFWLDIAVTLECLPELLHWFPNGAQGEPNESGKWQHPLYKWQQKPGLMWTQKDWTEWTLFEVNRKDGTVFQFRPLAWPSLEMIAALGITGSGAYKPQVREVWQEFWKLLS